MTPSQQVLIRVARTGDFEPWFALYEAVAAEGKWIGGEAPSDAATRRQSFLAYLSDEESISFLAEAEGNLVGALGVEVRRGIAEFGMMVDSRWRGRRVGSSLLEACIDWAEARGAHKITLQVWPHNTGARALYRKYGFEDEAILRRHYRRRNGELWDAIGMGLVLDRTSPGCPYETG
jgi:RimJ/RimL family protein N-acetyltransferase